MERHVSAKSTLPRLWDVAVLVKDLDKVKKHIKELGIGEFIEAGHPEGAEGLFYQGKPFETDLKVCILRIGNMNLEFIQPDDGPNPWSEYLKAKGEGIHHIGFQVENVEKEANRLIGLGAEVPFYGKVNGEMGAAYVDLKIANLIIELTSFCDIPE